MKKNVTQLFALFFAMFWASLAYAQSPEGGASKSLCRPPQNLKDSLHTPSWYGIRLEWDRPSTSKAVTMVYENGPVITKPGAGVNHTSLSEKIALSNTLGGNAKRGTTNPVSLADDFVLDFETQITTIDFYGFQYHYSFPSYIPYKDTTASPFTGVYVKIFNVKPTASTTPVWGDFTTNRLASTSFSRIYRVPSTDLTNVDCPLYKITASINTTLQPGTYWVEVCVMGQDAGKDVYLVPVSLPDQPYVGNALARTGAAAYGNWLDGGGAKPQHALAFSINGVVNNPILGYNVYKNGMKKNSSLLTNRFYTETIETGTYTYGVTAVWDDNCESVPVEKQIVMKIDPCELSRNTFPFIEGFEGGKMPSCWTEEYTVGAQLNSFRAGGYGLQYPFGAASGVYNTYFYSDAANGAVTKLITPMLDLTSLERPGLNFYHAQATFTTPQGSTHDSLIVYYKSTPAGPWKKLASYNQAIETWTKHELMLPEKSDTYWIAFEEYATGGRGVVLDDITVEETACEGIGTLTAQLHQPEWYRVNLSWEDAPGKKSGEKGIVELFDNGPIITNPGAGYNGADISAMPSTFANSVFGAVTEKRVNSTICDDFTLTENAYVSYIDFYVYDGRSSTTSSVKGIYVRFYDADPRMGGVVIWGNLTDNLLNSSAFSNIYRTPNAAPLDVVRPIFTTRANINRSFEAGKYWVEVTYVGNGTEYIYVNPVAYPGAGQETGNALLCQNNVWKEWKASSCKLGMPFKVFGSTGENPVLGYNVYRDGVKLPGSPTATTSYSDLLTTAGDYTYSVTKLWNTGCESFPTDVLVHMPADPCASAWNGFPIQEGFEGEAIPTCWTQEPTIGATLWSTVTATTPCPATAHSGSHKVKMEYRPSTGGVGATTKLIMPQMDLTSISLPVLDFWHAQCGNDTYQDELRVYYKNSPTGEWIQIAEFISNISDWKNSIIDLPNPTATYWVAFEGLIGVGEGILMDDITIKAKELLPPANLNVNVASQATCTYQLTWSAPEGGNCTYNVYRDDVKIASNLLNPTYRDENVGTGIHAWCVTAVYGTTSESTKACKAGQCTVGVEDKDMAAQITLLPNPANTYVTVKGNNVKMVEVYNALGQFVEKINITEKTQSINVESYKSGVYMFRVYTSDQKVVTKRLVVAH